MNRELYQVIRRPLLTEKNMHRVETRNQYTFEVAPDANKIEIRNAVEKLFDVKVKEVNTMKVKGKRKRHGYHWHVGGSMKKAVVTLPDDQKIDLI